MQRIQDPTAVTSQPAPPALTGQPVGFFQGSVNGGIVTRLRYWWLNMIQEELIAILVAASMPIDGSKTVLQALRALFMSRGGTTGNSVSQIFTPTSGGTSHSNVFTFTPSVPGTVHVVGSINLGAPAQQPTGCVNQVAVNGVVVSNDNTTGPMCNHGVASIPGGVGCSIQQIYGTAPSSGSWCSTSMVLSFIFVPN